MIHFDIEKLEKRHNELENLTLEQGFWDDAKKSSEVLKELNSIKGTIESFNKVKSNLENLDEYSQLIMDEDSASETECKEIIKDTNKLQNEVDKLQINTLLSDKYDKNNAILTIHPGAGGTEAQDF